MERILPISTTITFKPFTSESIEYKDGKLLFGNKIEYKCLKIIAGRYKVYVDYGFKGNSRYANDKSDYYVVDIKENIMLFPSTNDYGSIVASLEKKVEEETPIEEKIAPFVTDTRVLTMTVQHLVQDGWTFSEMKNGDLRATNESNETKVFKDEKTFKKWIFTQAENY